MAKITGSRNRYQRRTNQPVTSSSRRAARIRGAQTARRTGSPDRMTRGGQGNKGSAKVTTGRGVRTNPATGPARGAQGPRTAPVQGPSRRTPSAIGGDTGRRGGTNQPAARSNVPRPQARGDRFPSSSMNKTAGKAARSTAAKAVSSGARTPYGVAAAALLALEAAFPAKVAKGTLEGKPSRPNNQKPKAKPTSKTTSTAKTKSLGAAAKDFDRAFAAARKAGKKEFTWRGKRYNTKLK